MILRSTLCLCHCLSACLSSYPIYAAYPVYSIKGLHGTAAQTLAVIAGKIDFLFFCVTDYIEISNHFGVVRDRYKAQLSLFLTSLTVLFTCMT